jgi:hypothetical protein
MLTQSTETKLPKGAEVRIACRYFPMNCGPVKGLGTAMVTSWGIYEITTRKGVGADGFLNATIERDDGANGVLVVADNGYDGVRLHLNPADVLASVQMARAA